MNILLVGSNGRMGKCVKKVGSNLGYNFTDFDIESSFKNLKKSEIKKIDVVLDFASPNVLNDELEFCLKNNKPLVICSTGHTNDQLKTIEDFSKKTTIFKTENTSLGVAFIERILKDYGKFLKNYDIKIFEKHHKNKKDSPSGTAKKFLKALSLNGVNAECLSLRSGTCAGEHQILLFGENEQLQFIHIAENREIFANYALKICEFIKDKKANKLYEMDDLFC